MNLENESLEPVIFELGKAVYFCQLFEQNMFLIIALLSSNNEGVVSSNSFKKGLLDYKRHSLGQIFREFEAKLNLPDNFVEFMKEGISVRNEIVHGFINNNSETLLTVEGRLQVIEYLRDSQKLINIRLEVSRSILNKSLEVFDGSLSDIKESIKTRFEPDDFSKMT